MIDPVDADTLAELGLLCINFSDCYTADMKKIHHDVVTFHFPLDVDWSYYRKILNVKGKKIYDTALEIARALFVTTYGFYHDSRAEDNEEDFYVDYSSIIKEITFANESSGRPDLIIQPTIDEIDTAVSLMLDDKDRSSLDRVYQNIRFYSNYWDPSDIQYGYVVAERYGIEMDDRMKIVKWPKLRTFEREYKDYEAFYKITNLKAYIICYLYWNEKLPDFARKNPCEYEIAIRNIFW